jgi:hypothetical protein
MPTHDEREPSSRGLLLDERETGGTLLVLTPDQRDCGRRGGARYAKATISSAGTLVREVLFPSMGQTPAAYSRIAAASSASSLPVNPCPRTIFPSRTVQSCQRLHVVCTRLCLPPPRNVTNASTCSPASANSFTSTVGSSNSLHHCSRNRRYSSRRDTRLQRPGLHPWRRTRIPVRQRRPCPRDASVERLVGVAHYFNGLPRHRLLQYPERGRPRPPRSPGWTISNLASPIALAADRPPPGAVVKRQPEQSRRPADAAPRRIRD